MSMIFRDLPCRRCKATTEQELVNWNGTYEEPRYARWCTRCKNLPDGGAWIPRQKLLDAGVNLDAVREIHTQAGERCAKCWVRGKHQLHHWAPKHLFGAAADAWPTDYLCKSCHEEWHRIVTPNMSAPKAVAR